MAMMQPGAMMPAAAPRQVRRAFLLLWLSWLLGVVEVIYVWWAPDPDIAELMGAIAGGTLLIAVAYAGILWCAMRRRNWARIVALVWCVIGIAVQFIFPADGPTPWQDVLLMWLAIVMELVAFYWLFTGAGAQWYRTPASDPGA